MRDLGIFQKIYMTVFINSDACLILTEWIEYSNINWVKVSKMMRQPAWVFDARSISNFQKVKDADLSFWRVGEMGLKIIFLKIF